MNRPRMLIVRGGAIGDFILTLPVLAALRDRFPAVGLEVLGYPAIARLALLNDLADAVHPMEARPLAGFFAQGGTLDPATAAFFAGFEVVVSFLYDPDGIFQTNVARCTRARFISGAHRPDEKASLHATEAFLASLQQFAIFDADPHPRIPVTPASPGPGRWLAVHPGSGSESKNWPIYRWAELLQRVIRETSHQVMLVGGEAEGERLERLQRELPAERVRVARNVPLDQLAPLLAGCERFMGHDSGITHLAAAVGLPCLVLWGPSNLSIWRPRGHDIAILQDDAGLPGLNPASVWEVLRSQLEQRPPTHAVP